MDYREADDVVFEALSDQGELIFSSIGKSKYPKTYRAMLGFVTKMGALKNGIFDAEEEENHYVQRVLFRTLFEHYLKFLLILFRHAKEKTDEPGSDFYRYCGASEVIDYGKALRVAHTLIGSAKVISYDEVVRKHYPEAALLSAKELAEKSAQFNYRSILRRLSSEAPELMSTQSVFLAAIVPTYAELSSFVHGGPMADDVMLQFSSKAEELAAEKRSSFAFLLSASVQALALMAISAEFKEFAPAMARTHKTISAYLAANNGRAAT